jgi:hypothetical protein
MLATLVAMPLLAITAISLFAYFRQGATAHQVWATIVSPFLTQTADILYSLLAKFGKMPTGLTAAEKFYRHLRSAGALLVGVVGTVTVGIIGISLVAALNPSIAYTLPSLVFTYLVSSSIFCFAGALLLWERRDYVYQKAQLKMRIRKAEERAKLRAERGEDDQDDEDEYEDEDDEPEEEHHAKKGKKEKDGKKKKGEGDPAKEPLLNAQGNVIHAPTSLIPSVVAKTLNVVGTRPLEQDRFNHLLQAVNVYWWCAVFGTFYVAASYESALLYGVWLWALFYFLAAVMDYGVGFAKLDKLAEGWWRRLNWAVLIIPAFLIPGIPYVDVGWMEKTSGGGFGSQCLPVIAGFLPPSTSSSSSTP